MQKLRKLLHQYWRGVS